MSIQRFRSEEEWLRARQAWVGASELAAVLGLSPWKTAFQLWLEKTGRAEPPAENVRMRAGKALEQVVLKEYEEHTGAVVTPTPLMVLVHDNLALAATPDAICDTPPAGASDIKVGVEAKTSMSRYGWGEPFSDDVPMHYYVQVVAQLMLAREYLDRSFDRWDVAAMFALRDFDVYTITYSPQVRVLWERILEEVDKFWWHVTQDKAPAVDGSDAAARWVLEQFRVPSSSIIKPATPEQEQLLREYAVARLKLKETEAEVGRLENIIKMAIGDDLGLEGEAGLVKWTPVKGSARVDWKAVAMELGATPELIAKHTQVSQETRRFIWKGKED